MSPALAINAPSEPDVRGGTLPVPLMAHSETRAFRSTARGVAMRMRARQSPSAIPGYTAALLAAALVVALPLIAQHVDGSADEFSARRFAFVPAVGWVVCAALAAVICTRHVQIAAHRSVKVGSGLALAYDALPVLLVLPWFIAVIAALSGYWLLMSVAAALCVYHVALVAPRLMTDPTPSWVRGAPTVTLVVANVFVDNQTPDDAARQLIGSGADVVVIVESTADFMAVFDARGGADAYPNRVVDPDTGSDYAVALVTNRTLGPRSRFLNIGALRVVLAEVEIDSSSLLIVALNPMATFDSGGHETWMEQLDALEELLPTLDGPVVLAGDLNSTRFRPEFERIMALGYTDAIDALGKGLSASFKLAAGNVLGGGVRLDHALTNSEVHGLAMKNLKACGSDHLPFQLDLAVRVS